MTTRSLTKPVPADGPVAITDKREHLREYERKRYQRDKKKRRAARARAKARQAELASGIRRCTECNCTLRLGNRTEICALCTAHPGWRNRKRKRT